MPCVRNCATLCECIINDPRHATAEALPELHACLDSLRKRLQQEKDTAFGAQSQQMIVCMQFSSAESVKIPDILNKCGRVRQVTAMRTGAMCEIGPQAF